MKVSRMRFSRRICFQPHGEWFWVKDKARDGLAVAVQWAHLNYDTDKWRDGVIYNNHGNDAGWTNKNKSFAEDNYIQARLCNVTSVANHQLGSCTGWESTFT